MEQFVADFQMRCLQCFIMTQEGPIQKTQFPKPIVEILQDTVDEAVHLALFNQSRVFTDTLQNLIKAAEESREQGFSGVLRTQRGQCRNKRGASGRRSPRPSTCHPSAFASSSAGCPTDRRRDVG
uniref:OSJNBb0058J09.12 protein n=1 Tax=Oryza sativa subsp. japonica TaxID=39947 RepID=Q7XWW7_ORYSJ|nr:OSJNBb0058J09.12 [Oryza sativa Japonica Group]